ncbi:hypothetical protein KSZ_52360 [Dictyobacter formicarum]|uniref:Uncharacterized protein n=1 Tax=Dictyobacter formicarum TaxID=2778368 RepID=A0ABQ3VLY6_9CHLR|nr:hypothetical protein KSZ_52360 [Dictyobacter formicarum]
MVMADGLHDLVPYFPPQLAVDTHSVTNPIDNSQEPIESNIHPANCQGKGTVRSGGIENNDAIQSGVSRGLEIMLH